MGRHALLNIAGARDVGSAFRRGAPRPRAPPLHVLHMVLATVRPPHPTPPPAPSARAAPPPSSTGSEIAPLEEIARVCVKWRIQAL